MADKFINWYPGHMAAAKRMMQENLKLIDLIIEIRDARIPYSSANPDIEKFGKKRIIVLNKADLADDKLTSLWIDRFKAENIPAISVSSKRNVSSIVKLASAAFAERAEQLQAKGVSRVPRALVAGIPNVGKSTIINSLCGAQKAKTGNKPGVTKGKQWIKTKDIELLDSPGLLWPRFDDQTSAKLLGFTGAINDDIFDLEELALDLIVLLREKYPDSLTKRYGITLGDAPIDDYEAICKKRGFILRKNEYDYSRCARTLFDEFRSGVLGKMTLEEPDGL